MTGLIITTNSTTGYYLGSTALNPVTVAAGVTITNVDLPALDTGQATYWTIVNSGSLSASGAAALSDGILLYSSGGAVTNMTGGSVTGYTAGISVAGSGTVVNHGTIRTTGTGGSGFSYVGGSFTATSAGVKLGGGGISNATGGLISAYFEGIAIGGGGSVVNAGTILAASSLDGFGVVLAAGGSVTNTQTGAIAGGVDGILTFGTASTVFNQGYIGSRNNLGIGLVDGGTLSNASTGLIYGHRTGLRSYGSNSLTVTNAAGGTIAGGKYGVFIGSANVSTVTNAGLIAGYGVVGVALLDGGTINNQTLGRIRGLDDAIYTAGSTVSTITNAGVLYGDAFAGILMVAGGSLTNTGSISGPAYGVRVGNHPGTVLNAGTILATSVFQSTDTAFASAGVQLSDGGTVTNSSGGAIRSNWIGVQVLGAAGTVMNTGSISDAAYKNGAGVQLAGGGVVTNGVGGVITSEFIGVQVGASTTVSVGGTVINQGIILAADPHGDGAGVWIHGPGAITNAANGLISGGFFGIVAYYQTTVVNQGTVFGTQHAFDAVNPGFADRIIDLPGGVFSGVVDGGNTIGSAIYSTLELASGASTGTIVNIGTFTDFGRIALDAGATWSVGGSFATGETAVFGGTHTELVLTSPSAASGAIMTGFAATDTIALSGITDVTKLMFNGDTLVVSESSGPGLTLQFAAPEALTYSVVGGATDITVPCFLPGTHILTDNGEVLVEKLNVGDTIVTLGGQTRRLCWIGQGRTLATRGQRGPSTPVIVRKGALADNVPHLDLRITKGHSLYLDGVLIPVEFLVNHRNILWDDRAQEVTVYHLELDAHDVLVANGAAAESYRDDGNRWLFQNANAGWDQPPKPPCAAHPGSRRTAPRPAADRRSGPAPSGRWCAPGRRRTARTGACVPAERTAEHCLHRLPRGGAGGTRPGSRSPLPGCGAAPRRGAPGHQIRGADGERRPADERLPPV
jgi:fibronectin-binding autotransporter adhesin